MSRLFSSDPLTRTRTTFHQEDGEYILHSEQDVTDIAELAKARYNAFSHKSVQKFKGEHFHHVANIPLSVLFDPKTGLMHDDDALRKWLNDSANSIWRTMPGRV